MKKHGWESEAALAAAVVEYLKKDQWDVYQEVEFHGGIADIVALRAGVIHVVECKLTFSFASMKQAADWLPYAHAVSVAIPDYGWAPARRQPAASRTMWYRMPDGWGYGLKLAAKEGIGSLLAGSGPPARVTIFEAAVVREIDKRHEVAFRGILRPQHKTFAKAGSPTGKRFTPFKETCENILAYVKLNDGCTVASAVENVKHHYRTKNSFRSCLVKLLQRDVIPGVRLDEDATSRAPVLRLKG